MKIHNAVKVTLHGVFAQGINIVDKIVLVPFFIKAWGIDGFGEWLSILAMVSFLAMSNFGIGNYSANRMAELWAQGDKDRFHEYYHSNLKLSFICFTSLFFVILLISFIVTLTNPFSFSHINQNQLEFFIMLVLLGCEISITVFLDIGASLYIACGDYALPVKRNNQRQIILLVGTIGVLYLGLNWFYIALLRFLVTFLILLYSYIDAVRRYPSIKHGIASSQNPVIKEILRKGSWFFGIMTGQILQNSGGVLLIQSLLGPKSVVVFSMTRTLVNIMTQVIELPRRAVWRESTKAAATNSMEVLKSLYNISLKYSFFLAAAGAVLLVFEGEDIFYWWIKDKVAYNFPLTLVFCFYLVFGQPWSNAKIFLLSWNQPKKVAIYYNISALLCISLVSVLARHYGVLGAAIGITGGELVLVGWLIPKMVNHELSQKFTNQIKTIYFPATLAVITTLLIGSAEKMMLSFPAEIDFILVSFMIGIIMLLTGFFSLNENEKRMIKSVIFPRKELVTND
jgi:O-antigen/teichoic acid export membrane protein